MIRTPSMTVLKVFWIVMCASIIFSCKQKRRIVHINPAFSKYIEAFTSGIISRKNTIRLQLSSDISTIHTVNQPVEEDLFSFSPGISGKAYWIDSRTIEFKPEKEFTPNELYEVSFHLNKVASVPDDFKTFTFNVQTPKPSFLVTQNGLYATGEETMLLKGQVTTADVEKSKEIESVLSASLNSENLDIKWQHNENSKTHDFVIENIKKSAIAGVLRLQWDGAPIKAESKNELSLPVPSSTDFKVLNIKAVEGKEKYISVQFSDAIAFNQQLEGLIAVSGQEDLSYSINSNEVKVYSADKLDGTYSVSVNPGIQNLYGKKTEQPFIGNLSFDNNFPSVKIHGRGIILPTVGVRLCCLLKLPI